VSAAFEGFQGGGILTVGDSLQGVPSRSSQRRINRQTISIAADRVDVAWFVRVGFDLVPQTFDREVHGPCSRFLRISPHFSEQLAAVHDRAGALGEIGEDGKLSRREMHVIMAAEHLQACEVERQGAKRELRHSWTGSTQDGTDSSDKLVKVEGLRHVVVGAIVEACEDVGFGVPRGHHNYRSLSTTANQAAQLEAILAGQHDVQEDEIGTEAIEALDDEIAVADAFNLEARVPEVVCQHVRQGTVIFDEKNAIRSHGSPARR
jgi:hypothetical protein